jgi:hypothetical protein
VSMALSNSGSDTGTLVSSPIAFKNSAFYNVCSTRSSIGF